MTKMKVKVDIKLCGVCGDKALGYNFNAVTCESCKAFFRRNALVQKEFKCPFNNQCDITTVTRRFCQKCRLDKCFRIGMCKDLIMSEQDKVAKRQKIEENRAKKRSIGGFKSGFKKIKKESIEADSQESDYLGSNYNTDSDSKDTSFAEQNYDPSNDNIVINYIDTEPSKLSNDESISSSNERLVSSSDDISTIKTILNASSKDNICMLNTLINNIDTNCNNNTKHGSINSSVPQSTTPTATIDVTKDVVNDVQRVNSLDPSPIESILCEAIKLEYEAFSAIAQSHSNSRELNDAERAKLNELIVANKALLPPVDDELNSLLTVDDCKFKGNPPKMLDADPGLLDVINLTALVIRRLIKMAKKINSFKNMCQEDQVALLKGGCTEIMILRSAMNYDPKKQTWNIPSQDNITLNVDVLKLAKGNIYQEHERFIKTFDPKWRVDENIILILCAVVLFTPERQRVIHQDVIKLEQNSYYYLLRRYLESIYPGCEAKSTFLKLIQKIAELHKLNEELINVYLDVNPSEVEPLLIEIFDLKHKQ
ncbi:nuclear hormone receptor HR96 isoform X2 [Anoplophora glabripennis]|uniref:nuclear hormone receptor HR96 isoform X2 n=1 Tax=Anoplophora glabripennis TaxID=217634 RepID=UPI000873B711|nr:nuclear hormone receptor HR96 isoform X2 [Anoplophora glabripennis]